MIEINRPAPADTFRLQGRQGAYYWSGLASSLFASHGIISAVDAWEVPDSEHRISVGSRLILRDTALEAGGPEEVLILETPLDTDTANLIKAPPRNCVYVEQATLLDRNGKPVGRVHRQRIRVRTPERDIIRYESKDPLWRQNTFPVELWPEDEEILARLDLGDGRVVPAVIRSGRVLIFCFPIFDIVGGWLAFPPLEQRYAGIEGGSAPMEALRFCLALAEEHHLTFADTPMVYALPYPEGFSCAFSVRHDYDRKVDSDGWRELMDFYDCHGIRASFGILSYLMPQNVLDLIEERGHEIQLHCFAHDELELRRQAALLQRHICQPLDGVTIHGGPAGIGYRGSVHLEFFERAGFSITEAFGIRDVTAVPVARITDGVPMTTANLMAPPFHVSLDGSTRPGDHRLDRLVKDIPDILHSGGYAVLMNHPDIHREALIELIEALNMDGCWKTTVRDAMRFARASRFRARVRHLPTGHQIVIGEPLEHNCIFRVRQRTTSDQSVKIVAGQRTTLIPEQKGL